MGISDPVFDVIDTSRGMACRIVEELARHATQPQPSMQAGPEFAEDEAGNENGTGEPRCFDWEQRFVMYEGLRGFIK